MQKEKILLEKVKQSIIMKDNEIRFWALIGFAFIATIIQAYIAALITVTLAGILLRIDQVKEKRKKEKRNPLASVNKRNDRNI